MTDRTATTDLVSAQLAADPAVFGGQGAELAQSGGRWVLTMTRELAHPPERIWPMLTEPGQLGRWSPVVPDRPLTSPGPAVACENPGDPEVDVTVLTCDPPRELVHRWGDHLLRWVLVPVPGGSRLTLEQTFGEGSQAALFGAGWHLCLAVLILVGGGQDVDRIVGERAREYGWAELRDRYQASLG
jgi:uncharacterized protein YndB with AHSA1/START domain